ncbi:hypothetical protein A2U01_0054682, partial [Trifolium medium]|nr:hypothetical protein [Trifolium medium]
SSDETTNLDLLFTVTGGGGLRSGGRHSGE